MRRRLLLATLPGAMVAFALLAIVHARFLPHLELCLRRGAAGLAGLLTILFQF